MKTQHRDENPNLMSREQAAKYLGVTSQYLAVLKCKGQGPSYFRVGDRAIRYSMEDLKIWANRRHVVHVVQ